MLIESISMKNWCQLSREVHFTPGYNAIIGKNGVGKSNLLAAIQFAFSGYTTHNLKEYIGYEADAAEVVLRFRLDDNQFCISRTISNYKPTKLSFGFGSGRDYGIKAIGNRELARQLSSRGINPTFFDRYIMVPQSQTTRWLKLTGVERDAWFSTVFDLDRFKTMYAAVSRSLDKVQSQIETDDEQKIRLQLQQDHQAATNDWFAMNARYEQFANQFPFLVKNLDAIVKQLKVVVDLSSELSVLDDSTREVNKASRDARGAKTEVEKSAAEARKRRNAYALKRADSKLNFNRWQHQFNALVRSKHIAAEYARMKAEHEQQEKKVENLTGEPPETHDDDLLKTATEELASLSHRYQRLSEAIEGCLAAEDQVCDHCGQQLTESHVAQLRENQKQVAADLRKVKATVQQQLAIKKKSDEYFSNLESAKKKLEFLAKSMKNYVSVHGDSAHTSPDVYESDILAVKADIDQEERELKALTEKLQKATSDYDVNVALLARIETTLEEGKSKLKTIDAKKKEICDKLVEAFTRLVESGFEVEHEDPVWLKSKLDQLSTSLAEYRLMVSLYEEATKKLELAHQKRQEADRRVSGLDKLKGQESILSELKDWLHPSAAPRSVASHLFSVLCGEINAQLNQFGDPFLVYVSEFGEIKVKKQGKETSAFRLSGGEQTLLSLAFWLSLPRVLRSNFGTLVLDEPTQDLDVDNLEFLRQVMMQHMNSPEFRHRQILVVTHAHPLVSSFQNVVHL